MLAEGLCARVRERGSERPPGLGCTSLGLQPVQPHCRLLSCPPALACPLHSSGASAHPQPAPRVPRALVCSDSPGASWVSCPLGLSLPSDPGSSPPSSPPLAPTLLLHRFPRTGSQGTYAPTASSQGSHSPKASGIQPNLGVPGHQGHPAGPIHAEPQAHTWR